MDKNTLIRLFRYENGSLYHRSRPIDFCKNEHQMKALNSRFSGKRAGTNHTDLKGQTYRIVSVFGKQYKEHRLIWLMFNGYIPVQIDHNDGNKLNNKIENLRSADNQKNQMNSSLRKDNKTGVTGVRFMHGKFAAQIRFNKKDTHLGLFVDFFEAVCARKSAENKLCFNVNHGKRKIQAS